MVLMCFLKLLKIKWTERVINETVFSKVKEKRQLWHNIKVRRDKIIGHILRHDSLTLNVIEDDIC